MNKTLMEIEEKINTGFLGSFFKNSGKILLAFAVISSQVYLLSAFEAHVINVTAYICKPAETRTMGFWKNHEEFYINCLPQFLGDQELNSTTTVDEIFDNANADDMRDMLKGQLLAMKFNICYFIIDDSEGEEFEGMTLNELVDYADSLLRDPNSTREEQERIKDLLDYLNKLHQIKYCSKSSYDEGVATITVESTYQTWIPDHLFIPPEFGSSSKDPETIITAHPESEVTLSGLFSAYFSFTSPTRDIKFMCKLNNGNWESCNSPTTYNILEPGNYLFQVFAIDVNGNYDRTPAVFSWTVLGESVEFITPTEEIVPPEEPTIPPAPPEGSTTTSTTTETI